MKKWEYKIIMEGHEWHGTVHTAPLERVLNELGEQGWEVIAAVGQASGTIERILLKRERPAETEEPTS
ncbi:MAG TPA: DUF4177 domain-containing protein [Armatimonadetes bacterium]|nr:DUF4177 domain-containing protein [Armatimonadota bacterium]